MRDIFCVEDIYIYMYEKITLAFGVHAGPRVPSGFRHSANRLLKPIAI